MFMEERRQTQLEALAEEIYWRESRPIPFRGASEKVRKECFEEAAEILNK